MSHLGQVEEPPGFTKNANTNPKNSPNPPNPPIPLQKPKHQSKPTYQASRQLSSKQISSKIHFKIHLQKSTFLFSKTRKQKQ